MMPDYYIPKKVVDRALLEGYQRSLLRLEEEYDCMVHTNEYGIIVDPSNIGNYRITFIDPEDYVWFILRWS